MKTTATLRLVLIAAALSCATASVSAKASDSTDRAQQALAINGSVPVKKAGPFVEPGTYLIQVAAKLGQPTARLADGTWLYQNYVVEDSDARGTLVVRFNQGRVSELALVTPTVATAMLSPKKASDKLLVANRE